MPTFRYLLFDADETLFDFPRAEHQAILKTLEAFQLPGGEDTATLYSRINAALWLRFNHGEITRPQLLQLRFSQLLEALGRTGLSTEEINTRYMQELGKGGFLLPGALELCQTLREKGYRMAVITNGASVSQHGRFDHSPITPCFQHIFISEDMGCQKPQAVYFDKVCEAMGIRQEDRKETLIIGDSLSSDIQGGRNAGIPTCWYNPSYKPADPSIPPDYTVDSYDALLKLLGIIEANRE